MPKFKTQPFPCPSCGKTHASMASLMKHGHANHAGAGWLSDVWNWTKKKVVEIAKKPSRILKVIPHPYAQAAAVPLDIAGFGKPRKSGGRKKGGSHGGLPSSGHSKILPKPSEGFSLRDGYIGQGRSHQRHSSALSHGGKIVLN
jgi:hypothetical protein